MRKSVLLFWAALALAAPTGLRAQDPGAAQDAEAAREKLLKASDELDNIQASSETTRASVDGVKTDVAALQQNVTALQNENTALKQQLADLQTQFDQYKADQAHERQVLIDNVADMIAKAGDKSTRKKKSSAENAEAAEATPPPAPETSTEVHTSLASAAPSLAPPPDNPSAGSGDDTPPPAPKKEKGYFHIVASGETIPEIAAAYRDAGIKVTSAEIRKANDLTPDSVLTPGQKIFIPKPGM